MTNAQKEKIVAKINKAFPSTSDRYPLAFIVDGNVTVSCEQGCKALGGERIAEYYSESRCREWGSIRNSQHGSKKTFPAFTPNGKTADASVFGRPNMDRTEQIEQAAQSHYEDLSGVNEYLTAEQYDELESIAEEIHPLDKPLQFEPGVCSLCGGTIQPGQGAGLSDADVHRGCL